VLARILDIALFMSFCGFSVGFGGLIVMCGRFVVIMLRHYDFSRAAQWPCPTVVAGGGMSAISLVSSALPSLVGSTNADCRFGQMMGSTRKARDLGASRYALRSLS
jgi:hypothetical protein